MIKIFSLDSIDFDVFHVEKSSAWQSPLRNKLYSTELSGAPARETIIISTVASPEPQTVTSESNSNNPTVFFGYGRQYPILPLNLNDRNTLETMTVTPQRVEQQNDRERPQLSLP